MSKAAFNVERMPLPSEVSAIEEVGLTTTNSTLTCPDDLEVQLGAIATEGRRRHGPTQRASGVVKLELRYDEAPKGALNHVGLASSQYF